MKKITTLIFLGLLSVNLTSKAQIILTQADMPAAGLSYITFQDTSSFTSPGPSGAGQIWDFSNLTSQNEPDTISYLTPDSTPYYELFPSSNLAGIHSAKPWGMNFEMFAYYNSGLTAFTGQGAVVAYSFGGTSVIMESHFSPSAGEFNLPFTYNNTFTDIHTVNTIAVYTPPLGFDSVRTIQHSVYHTVADGWGTVITPYNTYSTLRLKTTGDGSDSTFYHTPGVGWSFGETETYLTDTYYKWWGNGIGIILTMNTWNSDYNYYDYTITKSSLLVSVNESTIKTPIKVFPNPAEDHLFIQSDAGIQSVSCLNSLGQNVEIRFENNSMDVSALPKGIYFLNIISMKGKSETHKFLKQ
jgi:hypothetical protein